MEDPLDIDMEISDGANCPASSRLDEIEVKSHLTSTCEPRDANYSPISSQVNNGEILEKSEAPAENEGGQPFLTTGKDLDLVDSTAVLEVDVELNDTSGVMENKITVHTENGFAAVQCGSLLSDHKRDSSSSSNCTGGATPVNNHDNVISGVKRARIDVEQQASVRVIYNCLTRDSRQKLEELLLKWSEWHTQHCSSSHARLGLIDKALIDSNVELYSGEGTYFPAINVGLDKRSAVSFCMDDQTRNLQSNNHVPLNNKTVPLYDREYDFGLTSADGSSNLDGVTVDCSRCFNCGGYDHSLKECPKPRDNVAVNSARKQLKSLRNQNASSRNPTRYYQDTPGGKYDGLRPGVLDAETKKLLGLGKLEPPPWLNRMRELGYPPGYLDPDDEGQPSGIIIFGEEEIKQETEDGEILDADNPAPPPRPELPKKMSVQFPGLNAPIPENADEWLWGGGPSTLDLSRNRSLRRSDDHHSSQSFSKSHYHEQRWDRDTRDDGPPGVDPRKSPLLSTFSPRYSEFDSGYTSNNSRGNNSIPRSPSYGRSLSERGIKSPLAQEGLSYHEQYGSEDRDYDRWTPDSSNHRRSWHEEQVRHGRR